MKPEVCAGQKIRVNWTQKFPILVLQMDKCNDLKPCVIHVSHSSTDLMGVCLIPDLMSSLKGHLQPISGLKELHIQMLTKNTLNFLCHLQISQFIFAVWFLITVSCSRGMVTLQLMGFYLFWWIIQSQKKVFLYDALKELYRVLKLCPFLSNCVHNSMNSVTYKLLSQINKSDLKVFLVFHTQLLQSSWFVAICFLLLVPAAN